MRTRIAASFGSFDAWEKEFRTIGNGLGQNGYGTGSPGGYALLEKRTVSNRGGLTGTQLRFGHDEGKVPHLYWVTLFVTDKKLFVLEAGGVKAEVERQEAQIEWSIKNFLQK